MSGNNERLTLPRAQPFSACPTCSKRTGGGGARGCRERGPGFPGVLKFRSPDQRPRRVPLLFMGQVAVANPVQGEVILPRTCNL